MQTLANEENTNVKKEELTYAGFFTRLLAYVIDIIIVGIGSFIIKNFFLAGFTQVEFFTRGILFNYSIVDMFTYLLKVTYFIICIYCTETTLGKYVMKIKVVGADGSKLTLFNIIYRETVGRFVSSFLCVGYLLILIDREKTALHDKLCDSRVIYGCNVKKTVLIKKQFVQQQQMVQPFEIYNNGQPVRPMNGPGAPYNGQPTGPMNGPGAPYNGQPTGPMNGPRPPYNGQPTGPMNGPRPPYNGQSGAANVQNPSNGQPPQPPLNDSQNNGGQPQKTEEQTAENSTNDSEQ